MNDRSLRYITQSLTAQEGADLLTKVRGEPISVSDILSANLKGELDLEFQPHDERWIQPVRPFNFLDDDEKTQ